MNGLADGVVLNIVAHLADKPSVHWNARSCWRVSPAVELELKSYGERKLFGLLKCKVKWIADGTVTESLAGRTAQKWQQTWKSDNTVRGCSHRGGSLQNGLGDEQTCGTTLASAYVLCHLSATWSQLQMMEKKSKWEGVLIGVSLLNTRDRVQWEFISVNYQTSELQCNY